jgi:LmbE family N-acetylglucosaminyl deacetylase
VRLPRRVLFVGAHCDDIELFAGGLLAELCFRRSHELGVMVFSDHRGVIADERAAVARQEMVGNLRWLAAESGTTVKDHTSTLLPACRGAFEGERAQLYAALEAVRDQYDLVVSHAATDTNQDHVQVATEVTRVFKAHATVLGGEFPSNDVGGFVPAVFIAIREAAAHAKARLVAAYRSQQFGGRPYLDEAVTLAGLRVRGAQIREPWAEAFSVGARVIVRNEDA